MFKEERSPFQRNAESYGNSADFSYSLGLSFGQNGNVTQVQWDGPAFNQGVTVGTQVVAVNGVTYGAEGLRRAVTANNADGTPVELLLKNGDRYRTVTIDYRDGLRYPHLEREPGTTDRLADVLAPRSR